jgi:hypothetical protein
MNKASRLTTEPELAASSPGLSRRQQKRAVRAPSFDEIVPASDGETDVMDFSVSREKAVPEGETPAEPDNTPSPRQSRLKGATGSLLLALREEDVQLTDETGIPSNAMDEDYPATLPSHRARAANPRVKMVEPSNVPGIENAIPVKARLLKRSAAPSPSVSGTPQTRSGRPAQTSTSKPGPGRSSTGFVSKKIPKNKSSMLTAEKGSLKSVKGKYIKPIDTRHEGQEVQGDTSVDGEDRSLWGNEPEDMGAISHVSHPQASPTAEELLDLAGLDMQNAEALPDFEEEPLFISPNDQPASQPITLQSASSPQPDSAQSTSEPRPAPQLQTDQAQSALQQRSVKNH